MRSVRLFRMSVFSLCLLAPTAALLLGCDGGNGPSTIPTQVSIPQALQGEVEVPDVVGMDLLDARAAVWAYGLDWVGVQSPVLDDWEGLPVLEQDPAPGTLVPAFSTIEVTYASPGTYVPDLVGLSEAEAVQVLDVPGSNLQWEFVYAVTPLSDYWGLVMAQSPAAGVLWAHDPPVTLVVGTALEPAVPETLDGPSTTSGKPSKTTSPPSPPSSTTTTNVPGKP